MVMRILVIAPHMDDEVLGCGATIASHVDSGDYVEVCICCHRVYDRQFDAAADTAEREATLKAKEILGYAGLRFLDLGDERLHMEFQALLDGLEAAVGEVRPDVVYIPHAGDLHQDHRTVAHGANIALRALAAPFVRRVLAYEVPSGTEQTFPGTALPFIPNVFVAVDDWIERKVEAMAAYERESRPFPHPRSPEMLRARHAGHGAIIGTAAAEAFTLLREMI
jgi:LmbE family N-acetylglucosaminyl deacetylase